MEDHFKIWLETRPDQKQFLDKTLPYPIYVVAAQGGGMYAAYHTAIVLSALADLCPAFASHVFAVSSVSGGSLGSAAFRTILDPGQKHLEPCADKDRMLASEEVLKILGGDFLSSLTAYLLFPDFLQRFLPWPVQALDRSKALENAFIEAVETRSTSRSDVARQSYISHWNPAGFAPALVLNTTEVASGQRRVIAPFAFPAKEVYFLPVWENANAVTPSLATATFASARSPWLAPSAWFDERYRPRADKAETTRRIRLVDGTYFENSGVTTAHELVRVMDRVTQQPPWKDKVEIYLLVLTSEMLEPATGNWRIFSELLDPVQTLLNAREARARAAIGRAEEELGYYPGPSGRPLQRVRRFPLEELGLPLPLGWWISSVTRLMIDMQVGERKRCVEDVAAREPGNFPADCAARQIYDELNQGLR